MTKRNKGNFFLGKFTPVIILMILLAAIWTRFSRVTLLGYFMLDEERDAFLVRRMLVDHRPLLIGGAVPGGFNLGPLFFYISAIPYTLANLHPIGTAYAAAIVGCLSIAAIYIVGRRLFNRQTALIATVFASCSLLNIIYHRPWWPLTLSQLVTLVTYLSLWNLARSDLAARQGPTFKKWLWMLTGALIVGAQSDPSTLSLIPLSIIWLWWNRKRTQLSKKLVFFVIGAFLLAHTTWFIFEFRHDFLNTQAILHLFNNLFKGPTSPGEVGPYNVLRMTTALLYRLFIPTGELDVTKQISPAEEFLYPRLDGIWWPGAWVMFGVLCGYCIVHVLKGRTLPYDKVRPFQIGRALLSLHVLISLGGMVLFTAAFPGYVHEWMWSFLFPTFFLIFADAWTALSEKVRPLKLAKVEPLLISGWAVWQIFLFSKIENVAGLGAKLQIVQAAQKDIDGRPYELRSEGPDALRYGGWRYLFTLYGDQPVKSYMDYVYKGWVYPKAESDPELVVRVINAKGDGIRYEIEGREREH